MFYGLEMNLGGKNNNKATHQFTIHAKNGKCVEGGGQAMTTEMECVGGGGGVGWQFWF